MKFLLVGASGFLGTEIMEHLRRSGRNVTGTRKSISQPGFINFDLLADDIRTAVRSDFFDDEEVVVIVSACICQIDQCYRERSLTRVINVDRTIQLLKDVHDLGAKPVYISSSYVFDGISGHYREDDPPNPICEYGRQKLAVEEYLRGEIPGSTIVRLDKLVANQPTLSNLFSQWMDAISRHGDIKCIEDQVFSPTSISDVARAVLAVSECGLTGVVHVANTEYGLRDEYARRFVELAGANTAVTTHSIETFPFDDVRPLHTNLDSARVLSEAQVTFTPVEKVMLQFIANAIS